MRKSQHSAWHPQLRQRLANPEAIDLQTFLDEIWNLESKTYLHSRNRELRIAEKTTWFAPSVVQLLAEKTITLEALEEALTSGDLELHGNYMWRQGTSGYDIRTSKTDQQKLEQIRKALDILNNSALLPLEKAEQIDAIAGFGEGNATGLVLIFHPDEFALINSVSRGILKKLGVNLTSSTSLQAIQSEMRSLKEALDASDFLELDLFLYLCDQGEYQLTHYSCTF